MIIVMGCYRSGTSAVAGILHHLGIYMGENFQEPNVGNPKGYFEDPKFIKLNQAVYEAASKKDNIALGVAKNNFHNHCFHRTLPHWGFKDPRFCLTAKHVMGTGPHFLNQNAKIIWIHRDVDENVMSIIKALGLNGLDANPDKWRDFVYHYVTEATNYMACHDATKVLDINFNSLMRNRRATIREIAAFVDVPPEYLAAYNFMGCEV